MKGHLISLSGIDGSGKTTLAHNLVKALRQRGTNAVYVYGRLQPLLLLPFYRLGKAVFLKGKDTQRDYTGFSSAKKSAIGRHPALFRLYRYVLYWDFLLQIMFKVRLRLMLGKCVVCDRYVFDTVIHDLAGNLRLDSRQTMRLVKKYLAVAPRPGAALLVDLPEHVGMQRKSDTPALQYLQERRGLYRDAAVEFAMSVVDGAQPPEIVLQSVLDILKQRRMIA